MEHIVLNLLELTPAERAAFEAAAPDWTHVYENGADPSPEALRDAEVILGTPAPSLIGQCRRLKLLQSHWSGTNEYLDVLPAGASLCGCAGAYNNAVSEHMCALLLALCHNLHLCRDNQAAGAWITQPRLKTLKDASVLILGAGQIAEAFAQKVKGLGAGTVTGIRRNVNAPHASIDVLRPTEDLDSLLPAADVVAMILPETPQTRGMMTQQRLRRMKPDAVLVNAGRGTSLDLNALNQVLTEGHLWGAAVDVTDPEPLPEDHPLWRQPRCIITPHIAGGFRIEGTREASYAICRENLRRCAAGEPYFNLSKEG